MKKIINENIEIERKEVSREEAIQIYKEIDDEYKLELIEAIPEDETSRFMNKVISLIYAAVFMYHQLVKLREFKLLSIAGAYWRGNSDNKMLQRIYGTAFFKKEDLAEHLRLLKKQKSVTIVKSVKN